MSKSLGNFEYASEVVNRIGADVFRLVFASVDYTSDMNVGENLFSAVSEAYRKIRNTCRFMLGNLNDFEPARDALAPADMAEFDRFIMARMERLKSEVRRAFENYDFQAAYQAILNFVVIDLSSLYIDVARDRLYCDAAGSPRRRSAQTALYLLLDELVRMLAPLIPFTADEIYSHLPGRAADSVHLLTLNHADPRFADETLMGRWDRLLQVRDQALKLLEEMRQTGTIGAPLEASIRLGASSPNHDGIAAALRDNREDLKDLFIVSDVSLLDGGEVAQVKARADGGEQFKNGGIFARVSANPPLVLEGRRAPGRKCPRCWKYFEGDGDLDPRCRDAVRA
jgi:isoleucyl-tRNA synthetase